MIISLNRNCFRIITDLLPLHDLLLVGHLFTGHKTQILSRIDSSDEAYKPYFTTAQLVFEHSADESDGADTNSEDCDDDQVCHTHAEPIEFRWRLYCRAAQRARVLLSGGLVELMYLRRLDERWRIVESVIYLQCEPLNLHHAVRTADDVVLCGCIDDLEEDDIYLTVSANLQRDKRAAFSVDWLYSDGKPVCEDDWPKPACDAECHFEPPKSYLTESQLKDWLSTMAPAIRSYTFRFVMSITVQYFCPAKDAVKQACFNRFPTAKSVRVDEDLSKSVFTDIETSVGKYISGMCIHLDVFVHFELDEYEDEDRSNL
jgi:hypothetical protein